MLIMSGNKFLTAFLHEQLKLIKEIALKLMDPNQCNAPRLSRAALRISGQKTHKKFFESP